jgi:hypothetical protein
MNRGNERLFQNAFSQQNTCSSRSNNVDGVSPVEFRKLCDLLETIFAQTVSSKRGAVVVN